MSMMMPTLTEDKVNLVSHLETQHVIEDVLDSKNCEMKKKNIIIKGTHLASATVPWHWLFFWPCPCPESQGILWAPLNKKP